VITGINNPTLITFSLPANPQGVITNIGAGGSDGGFFISDSVSFNGQTTDGTFQFISNPSAAAYPSPPLSENLSPRGRSSPPDLRAIRLSHRNLDESEYDWAGPNPIDELLYRVAITPETSAPSSVPEPSTFALLALV
jgi:hypothetical protein